MGRSDAVQRGVEAESWYDAYAFCIWDGGFLPSEAELEYAAAGGSQQREYPWGSTDPGTDSQHAIYGCSDLPSPPAAAGAAGCAVAPVGMAAQQGNGGLPAGRYYGLGLRCARSP